MDERIKQLEDKLWYRLIKVFYILIGIVILVLSLIVIYNISKESVKRPLTVKEFGQEIKLEYSAYANQSDEEVGFRTLEKYPSYRKYIQLEDLKRLDLNNQDDGRKTLDEIFGQDRQIAIPEYQLVKYEQKMNWEIFVFYFAIALLIEFCALFGLRKLFLYVVLGKKK